MMPLFGNKFSPKKAPSRKKIINSREPIDELVSDQRNVHLKLGEQQFIFENGEWIPEMGRHSTTHKSNQKLRKKIVELQEENNLLQLKFEMMLNMLTQSTAESHIQQREIEKIKKSERNKQNIKNTF